MPIGALAAGLVQGAASLFGGFGAASAQRDRDKANVRAVGEANRINDERAVEMNRQLRARADAAALVPVVTTTKYGRTEQTSSYGDIDIDGFLEMSRRTGINPITMVRSGQLGLYGRTYSSTVTGGEDVVTTTGERAMDAALAGQNIASVIPNTLYGTPPQNTMSIMSGALSDGYGAYASVAQQDAQNAAQLEFLNRQLAARRDTSMRGNMGSVAGGYVGGGTQRAPAGLSAGRVNPAPSGKLNPTTHFGSFTAAPFDPKTEYDDWIASADQAMSDIWKIVQGDNRTARVIVTPAGQVLRESALGVWGALTTTGERPADLKPYDPSKSVFQ